MYKGIETGTGLRKPTTEKQPPRGRQMRTLLAKALNLMQTEGLTPDQAAARVGASDDSRRGELVRLLETARRVSKAERPLIRKEAVEKTRRKLLDVDEGKRGQGTK